MTPGKILSKHPCLIATHSIQLTCKKRPILRLYIRKTERRHRWPDLAAVNETRRDGPLKPLPDLYQCVAREERLHAEEVAVEDGCEDDLIHAYFCSEREEEGGVVEGAVEVHEPTQ